MSETPAAVEVGCPYCGEVVEVGIESDLAGEMVWDCEVCCRPWTLAVERSEWGLSVTARTADD